METPIVLFSSLIARRFFTEHANENCTITIENNQLYLNGVDACLDIETEYKGPFEMEYSLHSLRGLAKVLSSFPEQPIAVQFGEYIEIKNISL